MGRELDANFALCSCARLVFGACSQIFVKWATSAIAPWAFCDETKNPSARIYGQILEVDVAGERHASPCRYDTDTWEVDGSRPWACSPEIGFKHDIWYLLRYACICLI